MARSPLERIFHGDTGRDEMADVARGDRQPVFERGSGDHQIDPRVTDTERKPPPSASTCNVDRQDARLVDRDQMLQP